MKKELLVNKILENVKEVDCVICKVYGVTYGVGYDLIVNVEFINTLTITIKAHATNKSWSLWGHLRPNNPYYKYTGSNDVYQNRVIHHYENTNYKYNGYYELLNRLTNKQLLETIKELGIEL